MTVGLILSAVLLYYAVGRLFDTIDPHRPQEKEAAEEEYQIALEDLVFAHELSRFLDPARCRFFTGSREEILSENSSGRIDMAVLNEKDEESGRQLHHMQVQYYASSLVLQENGIDIQLLRHQSRTIEVYYKDRIAPVLQQMMDKGVIVRT